MDHQTTAFITGITGQDGSYLAELLLDKSYRVVGLVSGQNNPLGLTNIAHLADQLILEEGDLLDQHSLRSILLKYRPAEIYNLAGVSFVPTAWERPTLALDINTLGVVRLLEIMRSDLPTARLFQASSAKIFGVPATVPQTETTPIAPIVPYGISKAATQLMIQALREHDQLYAACGILYNHESERRGVDFVTRKVTLGAARIKRGELGHLELGDLDSQIDWGYAPDFVEAMWLMLQQNQPDDYILATGQLHTIRELCEIAFDELGLAYADHVRTDPQLIRANETRQLVGDSRKARTQLGWQPKVDFTTMVRQMVRHDYQEFTQRN